MLRARVLSALVAAPIVIFFVVWSDLTMALLVAGGMAVGAWEFFHLVFGRSSTDRWIGIILGIAWGVLLLTVGPASMGIAAVGALLVVVFLVFLFRLGEITTITQRAALTVFGILYAVHLFAYLYWLRLLDDGIWWVFLAFAIAWAGDTAAYFGGKAFGRHRLYPRVSPKKTWEGSFFGLLGSVAAAFLFMPFIEGLGPGTVLALAIPGGILGQMGDLCESLVKRSVGAKDSGRIMPGHGGVLDRTDAVLFIATYLFLYTTYVW